MDEAEGGFSRLRCNRFDEFVENAFSDNAKKLADLRVRNFLAGVSDGLLEKRKSVAKAAFRSASENRDSSRIDLQVFRSGDALDLVGNFPEGERTEVEKLRAR